MRHDQQRVSYEVILDNNQNSRIIITEMEAVHREIYFDHEEGQAGKSPRTRYEIENREYRRCNAN